MNGWKFVNEIGDFSLDAPQNSNYLYFPLVNEAGMMSAITPQLHGDAKTGQHSFLLPPVSVEDLHHSRSHRNFWVRINGEQLWAVNGCSAVKDETTTLQAGFLWHRVSRKAPSLGVSATVTSFVPMTDDTVELLQVQLANISDSAITLEPTAAAAIYARSADNLRDHRHVTSLLHRITCSTFGVQVKPTLSFDERGHTPNHLIYAVLGMDAAGNAPQGFIPVLEDFIGEGGSLEKPAALLAETRPLMSAGSRVDGYEAFGGLCFDEITLLPGESTCYVVIMGISDEPKRLAHWVEQYGSAEKFAAHLAQTEHCWHQKLATLGIKTNDANFDRWLNWVNLQPVFRRLFGNSFLPYHDYGRGGRGWRDLWQDILALLLTEHAAVDGMLLGNFAGIRLDGSNATIIGSQPGEFKADRNNIPRVWMDHGAWVWLTTRLYINQTGDLDFLLQNQAYFKDQHIQRCQAHDEDWQPGQGTCQLTTTGQTHKGTVLEHLLLQHLTAFYHVGEHNTLKLEGADWNDGMDMARERGESVAFTALYASNLQQISEMVLALRAKGVTSINLTVEMKRLLDTLDVPVNYESPSEKLALLQHYFNSVRHTVSGEVVAIQTDQLATDLAKKAQWMIQHLRKHEWLQISDALGWFNGYYDNDGNRLEGEHPLGVRMTLTGQVFALMGGIADEEQTRQIMTAADLHLFDEKLGGYRLNTDFKEVLHNMGRCFGFAFGHKENGAMFSHMAVMYAYALYERRQSLAGYRVLETMYQHFSNFATCRMYPGIPEYVSERGRGMYTYLTGSASWYLLTLVTKVFGVRGDLGDLVLDPQLTAAQFNADGDAVLQTLFAGRNLKVHYHNLQKLEADKYQITQVQVNLKVVEGVQSPVGLRISRQVLMALAGVAEDITVDVMLG